jgi:hypothetical protein
VQLVEGSVPTAVYVPPTLYGPKFNGPPVPVTGAPTGPPLYNWYVKPGSEPLIKMFTPGPAAQRLPPPDTVYCAGAGFTVITALPDICSMQPVAGFVAQIVYVPAVVNNPKLKDEPVPATAMPTGSAPL